MAHELIFYGLTIFLLLLISAFFSAAETAMTAISRARIYQLVMDGSLRAKIVTRLRQEKESMIGTVLLGNTAANIAASAMATSLAIQLLGHRQWLLAGVTLGMTILMVVFAEVLPKTYAIQNAERVSLALGPLLFILMRVFYPLVYGTQLFVRALFKLFGIDITGQNTLISASDVLRGTIELHHKEGKMIKQDRDMLGSILDLNDIEVKDIMLHRKEVETIDADLPAQELIARAVVTMHSRVPLWRNDPDNIVGLLHVKNLIRMLGEAQASSVAVTDSARILAMCTKPWFIPETTTLHNQLLAFRHKRQHFAFVVDEYGSWQGIVTLEDIIEEIVGNIDDEHDEASRDILWASENTYQISGSASVRDVNRQLDWHLPDEHASTVAGLLIHHAERIPAIGEEFSLGHYRFTVLEKKATQLTKLKIEKRPEEHSKDSAGL